MKRVIVLALLLLIAPLVSACYNPMDSLALEVRLNKPGIQHDLTSLKDAKNVIIENGSIIYRSHYDDRVAVILKEVDSSLLVRIQIPAKSFESKYAYTSFETPLLISNQSLEQIKALGWDVEDYTFRKRSLFVQISSRKGDECESDSDCATGGCSGEVCAPKEVAKEIVTPCVYREWYNCLRLTQCGCYNGLCTWKPNSDFEKCLKDYGVDPSKVIKLPLAEVYIADYGKEKPSEGDIADLKALFEELGIACAFEEIEFKTETTNAPVGVVDPYSFNFKEALRVELEWLKEKGIINISDEDIEAIVEVAEKGKSGYNSHIGWYEKGGKYSWIAYDESDNPLLLRCVGQPFELKLPSGQVELSQTTTPSDTTSQQTGTICGPGLILGLVLVARVFRK